MKEKFKIQLHSIVDVITNSSTEIFVVHKSYGLEFVTQLVKEAEEKYPPKYPHYKVNIYLDNPEYCDKSGGYDFDKEEAIKRLISRGYTVIAPEVEIEPQAIIIECEQGYISKELKKFIIDTFNAEIGW